MEKNIEIQLSAIMAFEFSFLAGVAEFSTTSDFFWFSVIIFFMSIFLRFKKRRRIRTPIPAANKKKTYLYDMLKKRRKLIRSGLIMEPAQNIMSIFINIGACILWYTFATKECIDESIELLPLFCKMREIISIAIDILKPNIRNPIKRINVLARITFLRFTLSQRYPVRRDAINEKTYPANSINPILS